MSLKTVGQVLLAIGIIAFAYAAMKMGLFAHALYAEGNSIGLDLGGIWRNWGVWIVLWLAVTVTGLFMVLSSRAKSQR